MPLLTICDADWGPSLSYGHYLRELSRTSSLWLHCDYCDYIVTTLWLHCDYTPLSYRLLWLLEFLYNDINTVTNTQNGRTLATTQLIDSIRTSPNTQSVSSISGHLAGVPGHHTVILSYHYWSSYCHIVILSYPPRTWIWPNSCVLLTKWSLWQIAGQNRPPHDSLSDHHLYMELIFCLGIHKNQKYLSVSLSHCSHETVSSLQLPGTGKSHIMTWLALCGVFQRNY